MKRSDFKLQRYRMIREIGRGTSGIVWEAFDKKRGEAVALKTMKSDIPNQYYPYLLQEARRMATLHHTSLVNVYNAGQLEDGRPFYTMTLIDGVNLQQHMSSCESTWAQKASILKQLCQVLSYAYQKGYVHRDVKPANVMIDRQGKVFLVDWGTAEHIQSDSSTKSESVKGTPLYIAPELIVGERATHASDQYAFGVILYQWLTGQEPFVSDTIGGLLEKIESEQPVLPSQLVGSQLHHEMDALCMRLLSKKPEERFLSWDDVFSALDSVTFRHTPPPPSWFAPPVQHAFALSSQF